VTPKAVKPYKASCFLSLNEIDITERNLSAKCGYWVLALPEQLCRGLYLVKNITASDPV
jgi:hypothetical protein